MQPLILKELTVLSPLEKRAFQTKLDRKATVITGENDTGKSSLIKSIYYALGAQPRIIRNWGALNVKVALEFDFKGVAYTILRDGTFITIFDSNLKPLTTCTSITKELAPYLARLFNFKVQLQSHQGKAAIPPPAFLYLPFYMDQDKSWTESWNSFDNLTQLKSWRNDLIEYHIGFKPNAYYETKGRQHEVKAQLDEASARARALRGVKEQLTDQIDDLSIAIDLEEFQAEIKEFLTEISLLQREADKVKAKLVELHNKKVALESQIFIVKQTLQEINSDYNFLVQQADHVNCPTCGAEYCNSFNEVFDVARDEDRCEDLLVELEKRLLEVNDLIQKDAKLKQDVLVREAKVREILARKREQIELKDLLESESRKKLRSVLLSNIAIVDGQLKDLNEEIAVSKKKLASFTSPEWRQTIYTDYRTLMKKNLFDLAVYGVDEEDYATPSTKIKEQGSDHPRALLAHAFAILSMIHRRSQTAFCPIIIDSPIQQEQDVKNHVRILSFIRDSIPSDSQLILGVVDAKGIDFGGSIIELKEKRQLLSPKKYEEAYELVANMLRISHQYREGNSFREG